MKRKLGWIAVALCTSAVVCASFRAIPEDKLRDPDGLAKSLGVSPTELKTLQHAGRQLGSDVTQHRPIRKEDLKFLLQKADKGGALAAEAYWHLLVLKHSGYRDQVRQAALKSAHSKNEREVYASINLLHYFGDPRWTQLALDHRNDRSELMQELVQEAKE